MTNEEKREMATGGYARSRRSFLEKNAPDMLERMIAKDMLTEHLAYVEESVIEYINKRVEDLKASERYTSADVGNQMLMIRSESELAQLDGVRMYVYSLPEEYYNSEEEEEEYDDIYDYSYMSEEDDDE